HVVDLVRLRRSRQHRARREDTADQDNAELRTSPTTLGGVVQSLLLEPFLQRERGSMLDTLDAGLRIPAISSDHAHASDVRDSAHWCATRMEAVGLEHVQLLETDGQPSVYGHGLPAGAAPTAGWCVP